MTSQIVEALREKAHEYELNSLAARERDDTAGDLAFSTVACTLLELAAVFEHDVEEAA